MAKAKKAKKTKKVTEPTIPTKQLVELLKGHALKQLMEDSITSAQARNLSIAVLGLVTAKIK